MGKVYNESVRGGMDIRTKQKIESGGVKLVEPNHPDLRPVFEMHRGRDDSYVGFYTTNPEAHKRVWGTALNNKGQPRYQLIGVRSDFIPLLMPIGLEKDAYHTINGIHPPWHTNEPIASAYRRKNGVKYLNANYADIDCHKTGQRVSHVAGAVVTMMIEKILPPWSMLYLSGRGVWLFWWLTDPADDSSPQPANIEATRNYQAVQNGISRTLDEQLPGYVDNLKDITRVTRVPGSVNLKAASRVSYLIPTDGNRKPYLYTLSDMMKRFDVKPERSRTVNRALRQDQPLSPFQIDVKRHLNGNRPKDEVKARGGRAMKRYQLDYFEILKEMRGGGFDEGCRYWGCYIYVRILRGVRMNRDSIVDRVLAFASQCNPPLPKAEAMNAIGAKFEFHTFKWSIDWIVDKLNITPQEGRVLEATDIPGKPWSPNVPIVKPKKAEVRRDCIRQIIDREGEVPSCAEMAVFLKRDFEIDKNRKTCWDDYKAMGITARRRITQPTLGFKRRD